MTTTKGILPKYVQGVPGQPDTGIPDVEAIKRMDRTTAGYALEPHIHGDHSLEIIYLARGHQTHVVNSQSFTMNGGDLLLVYPNDEHSTGNAPEEKGLIYWVIIILPHPRARDFLGYTGKPAQLLLAALRDLASSHRARHFAGHPSMQTFLDTILHELVDPDRRLHTLRVHANLMMFLYKVLDCAEAHRAQKPDAWTTRVLAFIDAHLAAPLSLDQIADHFGISKTWLIVRFKRHMGMPPAEFILRHRIERAKQNLASDPGRLVTDIAMDLGFSSSQDFARAFKRYTGVSPQAFRRNVPSR